MKVLGLQKGKIYMEMLIWHKEGLSRMRKCIPFLEDREEVSTGAES